MRIDAALAAAALLLAGACNRGGEELPAGCGLPTPDPAARPELIPDDFLLAGEAEVATAARRKGGVTGVLTIQKSVQDGLPLYKDAIDSAGYELIAEDNEGFEAELYMRKGKSLGQIQLRTSVCEHASVVFVNLVKGDFSMPIATTPSPSPP